MTEQKSLETTDLTQLRLTGSLRPRTFQLRRLNMEKIETHTSDRHKTGHSYRIVHQMINLAGGSSGGRLLQHWRVSPRRESSLTRAFWCSSCAVRLPSLLQGEELFGASPSQVQSLSKNGLGAHSISAAAAPSAHSGGMGRDPRRAKAGWSEWGPLKQTTRLRKQLVQEQQAPGFRRAREKGGRLKRRFPGQTMKQRKRPGPAKQDPGSRRAQEDEGWRSPKQQWSREKGGRSGRRASKQSRELHGRPAEEQKEPESRRGWVREKGPRGEGNPSSPPDRRGIC